MREFLKNLSIEGMTDECIEKIMKEHGILKEKDKQTIAVLNTEISELKEKYNTDLAALEEKYKPFDGVDLAKLRGDLSAALETNAKLQGEFDGYKETAEKDALLRESLAGIKFSSSYARNGIYADVKDKVKYEDGKLTGFDEAIKALKEAQPAAFAADTPVQPPKNSGAPHNEGGADLSGGNTSKFMNTLIRGKGDT